MPNQSKLRNNLRNETNQCVSRCQSAHASIYHRPGFTIVELIAALILLGIVLTLSITLLGVVTHQRYISEQRQFALQHAANLLERTASSGWSRLQAGPQAIDPAPVDVTSILPKVDRRIEVTLLPDEFHSKLITVSISWQHQSQQIVSTVRLSGWVYPLEETP